MSDDNDEADLRSRTQLAKERKAEEKRLAALANALVGGSQTQLNMLARDEWRWD